MFRKKVKLVTHDGNFHSDEILATAFFKIYFEKQGRKISVTRTRDLDVISKADIVYDTGNIYDHELKRYDHHMTEGAGARDNGIPYCAFGLVWKHYGKEMVLDESVWKAIDTDFVQQICASDNGYMDFKIEGKDMYAFTISRMFAMYRPDDDKEHLRDEKFMEAVGVAESILKHLLKSYNNEYKSRQIVEKAYEEADDKRLVYVDGTNRNVIRKVLSEKEDTLFAIANRGDYYALYSLSKPNEFEARKDLPKEWGGLIDEELQKVTGVETARFCHRGLFLARAQTLEDIKKMAQMAIEY